MDAGQISANAVVPDASLCHSDQTHDAHLRLVQLRPRPTEWHFARCLLLLMRCESGHAHARGVLSGTRRVQSEGSTGKTVAPMGGEDIWMQQTQRTALKRLLYRAQKLKQDQLWLVVVMMRGDWQPGNGL
jgi:hypothetical protein